MSSQLSLLHLVLLFCCHGDGSFLCGYFVAGVARAAVIVVVDVEIGVGVDVVVGIGASTVSTDVDANWQWHRRHGRRR